MNLSGRQLYDLARGAGLGTAAATLAAAVALAESGGNPDAVGDVGIQTEKWGPSIGLWQVRSLKADLGTGRTRDASRLTDPEFNARSMATISGAGSNFKPWSVYTSGKYREHLGSLDDVRAIAGGPVDAVADAVGGAVDALNPFKAFEGWQGDAQRIGVTLAVGGAALWLVVAGVRAAAGGDE